MSNHWRKNQLLGPFLVILALLVLAAGCAGPSYLGPGKQEYTLRVIHVNDTHSHLDSTSQSTYLDLGNEKPDKTVMKMGSYPRLAAKVAEARAEQPNSLFLHAGDLVQGSLYFIKYNGQAGVDFMNMMDLDAMCLGNHEFDKGPGLTVKLIEQADFPILSANVEASPDSVLRDRIKDYIIKEVGGEKIGIIGLITPETKTSSQPGPDITFKDPVAIAQKLVSRLESEGVNKIILLTHQGYEEDLKTARLVDGVDIIVGGHSHTLLGDFKYLGLEAEGPYPTKVMDPSGDTVCVVTDWRWAFGAGILDVTFSPDGTVQNCGGSPVIMAGDVFLDKDKNEVDAATRAKITGLIDREPSIEIVTPDPAGSAMLAKYHQGIEAYEKDVIAQVAQDLLEVRVPYQKHESGVVLKSGGEVAPHVALSMLEKFDLNNLKVQLAMMNAGGVRTDLDKGDLTVGNVYEVLPFGNELTVLELTGSQIKQLLESWVTTGSGSFPYLAGARFSADMNRPEGRRITSIELKTGQGWIQIEAPKIYRFGTISYVADQISGAKDRYDTGFNDAEAFQEYAVRHSPLKRISTNVTYKPAR